MVHTASATARTESSRERKTIVGKEELVNRRAPSKAVVQTIKLRRLQIKLSDKAFERLEKVRALTDAVSAVDVIRDALRVYEALVEIVSSGKDIVAEDRKEPSSRERLKLW